MKFAWDPEVMGLVGFILTISLVTIVFLLSFLLCLKVVKRKAAYFVVAFSYFFLAASIIFNLFYVALVVVGITSVVLSVIFFANIGELRSFIANPFKKATAKTKNFGVEKIYDRAAFYKQVESAVLNLSKTRTGALMTFEKNTSLKDFMANGVAINAPVSSELLMTIFYPGTRLHDGAVIIHANMIVAASVFYTPTTKAYAGKYGSRHRAAIGISEVSDAVTVVVSEETGRISFAVNGELETVDPNNFLRVFETYMADDEKED